MSVDGLMHKKCAGSLKNGMFGSSVQPNTAHVRHRYSVWHIIVQLHIEHLDFFFFFQFFLEAELCHDLEQSSEGTDGPKRSLP